VRLCVLALLLLFLLLLLIIFLLLLLIFLLVSHFTGVLWMLITRWGDAS
jgi:hypothetical protein